jgi:hypothetical protein
LAVLLTSCATYKAGQTPDDVYYSPAREASVVAKKQSTYDDRYQEYVSSEDDRYLRMKIRNRNRWSMIDDYDYWNDSRYVPMYGYSPYRYNQYAWNNWNPGYFGSNWGSMYGGGFGYVYNPFGFYGNYYGGSRFGYGGGYYSGYGGKAMPGYISKRPASVSRPALSGYSNRNYNNSNRLGNTILKAFTPSNNNNGYENNSSYNNTNRTSSNNNTYSSPERTYSPSSSGSSGSGSSGSSGGGVSRPARGGN